MKKTGIIIFAAAILIGVAFTSFLSLGNTTAKIFNFSIGSGTHGSGNVVLEKRDVGDFNGVDVGGVFQVEIVAQKDPGVEIEADDNLLPLIKTEVNGGVLKISTNGNIKSKSAIRVRISALDIDSIEASGASKVSVSDIKNSELKIDTSGASKVTLSGETGSLSVDISGASSLNANGLKAENATVDASGASYADVNVSEQLIADASGASKINYSGSPKSAEKHSSGAGHVTNN